MTGLGELDKKLAAMPLTMQKKAMRRATREVAKEVLAAARQRVPRKTQQLKKTLRVRAQKRSRKAQFKHDVGHLVMTLEGMFKGDTFYGGFIEFGTGLRHNRRGQYLGQVPRDKFAYLRPSLYEKRVRKRLIFEEAIKDWMREQAKKNAAAGA